MLVELIKIRIQNPRIIILYDFQSDITREMTELLKSIFRLFIRDGISIVVAINDYTGLIDNFDKLYLVTDGHIGKTLYRGEFSQTTVSNYLLTDTGHTVPFISEKGTESLPYLRLNKVCTNKIQDLSIEIREGEIVGVFDADYSCGEEISRLLIGDRRILSGDYYIAEKKLKHVTCRSVFKHKIGYISCLGNALLFPGLTAQENATVVIWDKIHPFHFLFREKFYRFAFEQIRGYTEIKGNTVCRDLDDKKQLLLQLSRWKLFNPKVLIVERPFMNGDVVQAQMIRDYLADKIKEGCSSIVISSNLDYLKRNCSRIIFWNSKPEEHSSRKHR